MKKQARHSGDSIRIFAAVALGLAGTHSGLTAQEEELLTFDRQPLDRAGAVTSYADAIAEARSAVVSVTSTRPNQFDQQASVPLPQMTGVGSGVIVNENGYILTAHHVVEEATEVSVTLADGREYQAEIVGTDPQTDVAVLKVESSDLPRATLADSEAIEVGDVVFAIGNPLGVGQTVTMGIISAKGRNDLRMIRDGYENFIQTDASINQGNSGGALVDARGRLIGINTMILTDGRTTGNIGIGFAIPVNMAERVMTSLVEEGSVTRGFLGVGIQGMDSAIAESFGLGSTRGALVAEVTPDSPAQKSGIRQGDVILKINELDIASPSALRLVVSNISPGTEVVVTLFRNGQYLEKTAVLADLSELSLVASNRTRDELLEGVQANVLTDELRKQYRIDDNASGIVITELAADSPHTRQLSEGMVIERIGSQVVTSVEQAREMLAPGDKVALFVWDRGISRFIAIDVK